MLQPTKSTGTLRSERGITGIETAIILIAFVVVASVFAYAVLSAGIFASDRGKEAIHAGLDRSASSLEIVGTMKADGVAITTLSTVDSPSSWTASANVTIATESSDIKEGTAAAQVAVGTNFATGLIAYEDLGSTVNLSTHYGAGLWIKPNTSVADGVLQLVLDDSANCGTPEESLNITGLTSGNWSFIHRNMTNPAALAAVTCVGLSATSDPGTVTLLIDHIQGPAELQQVHVALSSVIPTEPVPIIAQADVDGDGLLSDETNQANSLVVSYTDSQQVVRDLAWSITELGRGDGDVHLEHGEQFLFTINLRAVDPVPTGGTVMNFHIVPHQQAALVFEKTVPDNITPSMIIP